MAERESTGVEHVNPQAAHKAAWALYAIVFTSGAVLMGVEIAGSRVLAPSFGTGIFVWGALIGLFMGAMAAGYYVGGRLADRYPSFPMLATVVSLAGVYTFLMIPHLGPWACEEIARSVTHQMWGPLIAATLLFFVPSFLMAMVSPYAVKLNTSTLSGVGGVAGKLYALSTFGSIVGTLLTTFVLIPTFCVSNVLLGLGLLLVLVAIVTMVLFRSAVGHASRDERLGAALMMLVALGLIEVWALFPVQPKVYDGERLLYYEESRYHDIAITEAVYGGVPQDVRNNGIAQRLSPAGERYLPAPGYVSRWLKFNENRESGIFPYGEYLNAVHYTDLIHLAMLWAPEPKRMLVVGGGGGVIPVQFLKFYGKEEGGRPEEGKKNQPAGTLEQVDVLELDPSVEHSARQYFQVRDRRISFKIGDARMNLKENKEKYDIILLDAYSAGGQIPFHLMTYEFLKNVKEHLTEQGVLVTNIIAAVENDGGSGQRPGDLFFAEFKTLTGSPPDGRPALYKPEQVYVFPRIGVGESLRSHESENRNIIVFATCDKQRKLRADLTSLVKNLTVSRDEHQTIVPELLKWHAENVYADGPTDEQLAGVPVLTDDYAPVDTMYRPVKYDEQVWKLR